MSTTLTFPISVSIEGPPLESLLYRCVFEIRELAESLMDAAWRFEHDRPIPRQVDRKDDSKLANHLAKKIAENQVRMFVEDDGKEYVFDLATFIKGFEKFIEENPESFADAKDGCFSDDEIRFLVQYSLFGEIRY